MINTLKPTTPRRSVKVPKKELATWKTEFADYGSKAAGERATGVPVQTIRNIVNKGRGIEEYVGKLRQYVDSRKSPEAEVKSIEHTANNAA